MATPGAPVKNLTIRFCGDCGFNLAYNSDEVPFELRVLMSATLGIPATDDKPS